MEEQDQVDFFSSIPVEMTFGLLAREAAFKGETQLRITEDNLATLADEAAAACPEDIRGRPYCIISRRSEPDEQFTTQEHFVPEGLGFPWTALPKGVGTCDRINEYFGKHELEWLRFGSMGCFRPFYVRNGKKDAPSFYAPKKSERLYECSTDDEGKFVMKVRAGNKLPQPESGKPGSLEVRVPAYEANSTSVSLALHKMAYLTLWLSYPEMVFDEGFNPLLRFLREPCRENFHPFSESFVPGTSPGLGFNFYVEMDEFREEATDNPPVFGLQRILVSIRAHHMLYFLSLLGGFPDGWQDKEPPLNTFVPLGEHRKTLMKYVLNFGSFSVRKPESSSDDRGLSDIITEGPDVVGP